MPLEELGDQVSGFGIELAAAIEGNGFGAVGVQDVGEAFRDVSQRSIPVGVLKIVMAAQSDLRLGQAVGRGDGRAELGPLGTDTAEVGGGGFHTADAGDLSAGSFHAQPATDPTVRADRFPQNSHAVFLSRRNQTRNQRAGSPTSSIQLDFPGQRERLDELFNRRATQLMCQE
jgi:hypothetical protein